jgi:hypothetical protein
VSQLIAVARKRLLLVLILMLGVGLVAAAVGGLVGVILIGGTSYTGLASAAILGGQSATSPGAASSFFEGLMRGDGGFGGGYATAATVGGAILFAAALTLPALVYLRGASFVYLRAVEGLDLAGEKVALRERVAAAQARAKEFQAQAQATAQQYAQRAKAPAAAVSGVGVASGGALPLSVIPAAARGCPACGGVTTPEDVFCANCGHRLS